MDIYCPRCAEPWDNEEMHERVAELKADGDKTGQGKEPSYDTVVADFRARGCVALGGRPCEPATDPRSKVRAEASAMLMELGDMDGAMSDLDDFEALGLFGGFDD